MKRILIAFTLITLAPVVANAVIFGGSNLGSTGYPSHDCIKPDKPIEPYSFDSQGEVDSYNSEVDMYNLDVEQYISCIREYVDNANNDIKRIKEKAQEAIDEANY